MNIFLVHGSFGRPFENWFPWLEDELAKHNIVCTIPTFPTPNHQMYSDWERLMDYYYEMGIVNQDTVLIGHSCGSVFLVHYLLAHKIKVAGLITVAGYNNFYSGNNLMDSLNSSFYIDVKSINLKECTNKIISYYSDDDPNIPIDVLRDFAMSIGAKEVLIQNAGHFNSDAGYDSFDVILDALKLLET